MDGGDFSSTRFKRVTAQGFWNVMDRFSDDDMKTIRDRTRDRLISPGYDDSKLFVDGSNFYIFIEENEVAKKGTQQEAQLRSEPGILLHSCKL